MTIYLKDVEAAHKAMFDAHWKLVSAGDAIHGVLLALHDRERYRDERSEIASLIENLRDVREKINEALHEATGARSELIRKTGCDGSCKERL